MLTIVKYIEQKIATNVIGNIDTSHPYDDKDDIVEQAIGLIDHIPAADVAPVRHGRWEAMHYEGGILDGTNFDKCSVCGYERIFEDEKLKTAFNYCPNCGTLMDLEGE